MSDPFIDALHAELSGSSPAGLTLPQDGHGSALLRWWEQFVDIVGQKVGAWNERQAPRPPVNFIRQANGDVQVWHRAAEATFGRTGDVMQVVRRLGTGPRTTVVATLQVHPDGTVVALLDGAEFHTATATAECLLTPLLRATFASP